MQLLLAVALLWASQAAAQPVTWQQVEDWTYAYADKYGADPIDMLRIARCESHSDPYAVGRLGEIGPYQFHPRGIWWSTPQAREGYVPQDIEANVAAAAFVYASGYAYTTYGWYWCARNGAA